MQRSHPVIGAVGVAALVLTSLGTITPAGAVDHGPAAHRAPARARIPLVGQSAGRPDPSFGPVRRRAAIAVRQRHSVAEADRLGLGPREALVVKDVIRDADGTEHVRYDRTYAGLPVVGGDLVVHEASSGATQVTRATRATIRVPSTTPELSGRAVARRTAERADLRSAGSGPVKVVFAAGHRPVLAWQTTVTGTAADGTPIRDLVYTDADTGAQLARLPQIMESGRGRSLYSGTVKVNVKIKVRKHKRTYQLVDTKRGGHATYTKKGRETGSRGTLVTDANNVFGNGKASNAQSAAVDAAYGAAETWDFYRSHFHRTGIRNNGKAAYSRVHFGRSYDNAFWDDGCFCMTYGDGSRDFRPVVALDIAGHEMTHGVTAATAGLFYDGDAGGLNESTSDVMGTMVEFGARNKKSPGNYLIGERVAKHGGFVRRMDDPRADRHSVNCWSPTVGDLDPHYSSGVGNHLFYLLAEGTGSKTIGGRKHSSTSCDGSTVTGIGRTRAAAIWYRALTVYWTSGTTYPEAADGQVEAARDLYGTSVCNATLAAWEAVDVTPTQTCAPDPSAEGNLIANPGFEAGASSWTQSSRVITTATTTGVAPYHGRYFAWLDGYGATHTDTLSQSVDIPAATTATLAFRLRVNTAERGSGVADRMTVRVTPDGGAATSVAGYSNLDAGGYTRRTIDLSGYAGQSVRVSFQGVEDASRYTDFLLDDLSLITG